MQLRQELIIIERELDRIEDTDSVRYQELSSRADEIVDELNKIDDILKSKQKAREAAELARIANIRDLIKMGKTEELIQLHGHEFINDYYVDVVALTIHSSVARDDQNSQWTEESEELLNKKLKILLYYRIYDHYMRDRS